MNEHEARQLASPKRRAAARAVDALVTAVLASLLMVASGCTALLIGVSSEDGFDQAGDITGLFILFSLLALIPLARYEVAYTARRGQTFGKGLAGIQVVRCDDQGALTSDLECPGFRCSVERWVVPHGAGLFVGVVAGVVAERIWYFGELVGIGAGLAVWTVVYMSSLWDKHGRGWHDKAAGTIVVAAPDPHPQQ